MFQSTGPVRLRSAPHEGARGLSAPEEMLHNQPQGPFQGPGAALARGGLSPLVNERALTAAAKLEGSSLEGTCQPHTPEATFQTSRSLGKQGLHSPKSGERRAFSEDWWDASHRR